MVHASRQRRPGDREGRGNRAGTTVRGMLILADWDEEAEIRQLAVLTDDDDEFVIEGAEYNEQLARHLEDEVVIWGDVDEDDNGTKLLRPAGFQIVDWFADSDEFLDTYDD